MATVTEGGQKLLWPACTFCFLCSSSLWAQLHFLTLCLTHPWLLYLLFTLACPWYTRKGREPYKKSCTAKDKSLQTEDQITSSAFSVEVHALLVWPLQMLFIYTKSLYPIAFSNKFKSQKVNEERFAEITAFWWHAKIAQSLVFCSKDTWWDQDEILKFGQHISWNHSLSNNKNDSALRTENHSSLMDIKLELILLMFSSAFWRKLWLVNAILFPSVCSNYIFVSLV